MHYFTEVFAKIPRDFLYYFMFLNGRCILKGGQMCKLANKAKTNWKVRHKDCSCSIVGHFVANTCNRKKFPLKD
jgi:hypothetical protein